MTCIQNICLISREAYVEINTSMSQLVAALINNVIINLNYA